MILGDVFSIHSGFTPRGRFEDAPFGVRAIQQGDITAGTLDQSSLPRVDIASDRYLVSAGDLVFRSRGQHPAAWVVPSSVREPLVAVLPLFILRPKAHDVDHKYLAWILNQPEAQRYFRQSSQGQSIQMVSKPALENTPIYLPSLARQERIATLDALAARERSLQLHLIDLEHQLLKLQLASLARAESDSALHQKRNAR